MRRLVPLIVALTLLGTPVRAGAASSVVFAEIPPPPAPDYALAAAWAARPGAEGAATAVPAGATPAAGSPRVDVFYVHPTTFRSRTQWNADVADAVTNRWTDASVVARQASAFNACCRVFAPRYRQASRLALGSMDGEGGKAFDLAYGDVDRAFAAFLAATHGQPFVLAGHSQGSFHLARLIERRIDGTPLARRLVAAYLIGFNLSEGDFGRTYHDIAACATPAQTRCIVQWNAVLPTADLTAIAASAQRRFVARYGDLPEKAELCFNPLTFDAAQPAAPATASQGAVPGNPGFGPLAPLRAHAVAARCDRGLLVVEPAEGLDLAPLPGGSMHYHDIGLFYADLRADAVRRTAAYLSIAR